MNSPIKNLPKQQRIQLHSALLNGATFPSCTNCGHCKAMPSSARAVDAFCTKANAFAPLDVLVVGCELWEDAEDDIPF